MAGFTALRDLGTEGAGYADVDVQRAINEAEAAYAEYLHGWEPGLPPTDDMQQDAHAFKRAMDAGITIGCGSDVGFFTHGTHYKELVWMVRGRLPPARALLAATAVDANIRRQQENFGQSDSTPISSPCKATPRGTSALSSGFRS